MGKHTPFVLRGKESLICKIYQKGFNAYKIADKLGVTSKSIYNCLEKQGVPRNKYREHRLEPVKEKLIQLYQKGVPVTFLAKKYHCCEQTITFLLKKEGIPKCSKSMIHKKPKIGRLMRQESFIKELYDKGFSYAEIAKKVETRPENICHFVKDRGWTRPVKRKAAYQSKARIPENRKLIVNLYTQNQLNVVNISRQSGFNYPLIKKILTQEGVLNA